MGKLKKCPFCGGKAELKKINGFNRKVIAAYVFCKDCGITTRTYATADAAMEAWNRRYYE